MSENRHRYRNSESTESGTLTFFDVNPSTDSMDVGDVEICDDVVGNRTGANPLSLFKSTRFFPYLDGTNGAWGFRKYPVGFHSTYLPDPEIHAFAYPTLSFCEELAWDLLANTNPSKVHHNVPQFVGELKDLPGMLKGAWKGLMDLRKGKVSLPQLLTPRKETKIVGLIRPLASANLSWKFTFSPLISDVKKALTYMDAVNSKLRTLKKLRDKKSVRKRMSLPFEQVVVGPTDVILHSQGAFITGKRTDVYTSYSWATAEWKLDPGTDIPTMDDDALLREARRLCDGITTFGAAETAWELLPWSWMADWFSNTQNFIAAHNNSVPCSYGRLCYMRTTKGRSIIEVDPTSIPPGVTLSGGFHLEVTRKIRQPLVPISVIPLPSLPILDVGQWSILTSLAALRLLKL